MQDTDSHLSNSDSISKKKEVITDQQVLIAGGGHVGLSFALLLAHHGIASTLLEKNKAIQPSVQRMIVLAAII